METKIPHQSVLVLQGEVMERLPDGRVFPKAIKKYEEIFSFKANSLEECETITEEFIKEVKQLWQEKLKKNV